MNAADNVNCVQQATASTGVCYSYLHRCVEAHRPKSNMFECCESLMQKAKVNGKPVGMSDADWIVQKLIELGYWARVKSFRAEKNGAWVPRLRAWWASATQFGPVERHPQIDQFFDRMLDCFAVPDGCKLIAPERMILPENERVSLSAKAGFPVWTNTGMRVPEKQKKEGGPDWKPIHMRLFQQFGLSWPVNWSEGSAKHVVRYDGLRAREAESLFFLVNCFDFLFVDDDAEEKTQVSEYEFIDINHQLPRVIHGYYDVNEDGSVTVKRSPWKNKTSNTSRFQQDRGANQEVGIDVRRNSAGGGSGVSVDAGLGSELVHLFFPAELVDHGSGCQLHSAQVH